MTLQSNQVSSESPSDTESDSIEIRSLKSLVVGNRLLAKAKLQWAGSLGSQDCILVNNKLADHSV